jgi:hypothetical protein
LTCAPALARGGAVQATDPSAGSPAGTVYQIPLDTARQDASPHHGNNGNSGAAAAGTTGGGSGGSGSGGAGTTAGGSASSGGGAVSGADSSASDTSVQASDSSQKPVLVPGGQPGSLVHSSNGFGSSSKIPGAGGNPASAGLGAVQSNASSAPLLAFLLAAVVLTLGGFVGLRAWRSASARRGGGSTDEPPQLPPPAA